ncbi:hypothetical protein [Borrelia puertoricensis]|uniref:hypothetical protein n=1 Tax=Borrelia puertoricensis TaxID=2756107 RepID=UPI001FF62851|nr:hypothetical protein [Borrelia puertoricensis]UPA18954.1 hypothetical protein bpuSUM_001492 [Borrelia puertoricensis]
MVIFIISVLGSVILSCAAGRKISLNVPTKLRTNEAVHTNHLGSKFDLVNPSLLEDLPQTPYATLLESVRLLRESLNFNSEGFDQNVFDSMFNDFALYFKNDDYYLKNCFYAALKHDVVYIEKIRQIVRALRNNGIVDYKDTALDLLISLRDSGIYVSEVVKEDGQILNDANLCMLQQIKDVKIISGIKFALDNLLVQRNRVIELFENKIRDILGLEKVESIKKAVDLIIGKNGEILKVIEVGNDSLLGLKDTIKNKIDDLIEQQKRRDRINFKIKERLEEKS